MNKKYAVCVGINDYPGSGLDLHGCVNDAQAWTDLLLSRGYEVDLIMDAMATKIQVMASLARAIDKARWGDRIVFTFSGHGSWVPDEDGDEADWRDEVLVTHNYDAPDLGGIITDDELHTLFESRNRGVRVVIFSDSCHSGTMSRFAGLEPVEVSIPRFMPPDYFYEGRLPRSMPSTRSEPRLSGTVLFSGCDDDEFSYDAHINGEYRGAFSYYAQREFDPNSTLQAWHRRIREQLPNNLFDQSPQFHAKGWQRFWRL